MSILKVVFSGDTTQLDKALTKAQKGLDEFGSKARSIGLKMSLGITAPIVAAGGAAIKLASDFEESLNKVDVSFKNSSNEVKAFAKTTLKNFGIAEGSALDMAALFGDMGTSMGLSTSEAAKMSTALVGLAGDMSSFKNITDLGELQTSLGSIFTGDTESLKKLGIVMTEANLQQFALSQGIKGNIKDFTQAEKTLLRYEYVMAMSANAHGDFARTGGGAANQTRQFQQGLQQLGVQFGQVMLPLFTKIVNKLNDLVEKFSLLSPETKKTILIFAGLAAAIGPLLIVIGGMASGISALVGAFTVVIPVLGTTATALAGYATAMTSAQIATAGLVAAVGAGLAIVVKLGEKIAPTVSAIETLKNAFLSIGGGAGFVMRQGKSEAAAQTKKAAAKKDESVPKVDEAIVQQPAETAKKIDMTPVVNALKLTPKGLVDVTKTWRVLGPGLGKELVDSTALIVKATSKTREATGNAISDITEAQAKGISIASEFSAAVNDIIQGGLADMAGGIGMALGEMAAGMGGGISSISKVLLGGIGDMAIQLGKLAIGVGVALLEIKAAFKSLGGAGAIAAGVALVALGSFVKGQAAKIGAGGGGDRGRSSMPAFANGGIVSGPTIGLMGEYPGAKSNPEVIAPLDKLQSMLNNNGGGNVHVGGEFVVRGQDLVVALQRADKTRNRIKG